MNRWVFVLMPLTVYIQGRHIDAKQGEDMMQVTQFGAILGMELPELIIVTIIVALILGGHKLPQLVRKLFGAGKKVTSVKREDDLSSSDDTSTQ